MALTNALSAIALVGSIVILGQGATTYAQILGFIAVVCSSINVVGGFIITDRMLRMFKPRAPAPAPAAPDGRRRGRLMNRMDWINLAYLVAALGFAFSLKWMTAAPTARRGVLAGEIGFGIAIVATLFWPGITTEGYILIAVARADRLGHRHPARPAGADDRHAPADRPLARLRRPGRGAGRGRALLPRVGPPVGVRHRRARRRDRPRVPGVHRQPDGRRQAAGVAAAAADHLSRAEPGELRRARRSRWRSSCG